MEIERTTFGTITIDGKTYEHDVIIRLSGEVARRKKKLSKKYYGTSHILSKDEAKFIYEDGCEQLILGSGQMGNVHLSPEAETYFAKRVVHGPVAAAPQAGSDARPFEDAKGLRKLCGTRKCRDSGAGPLPIEIKIDRIIQKSGDISQKAA
jgi:hypothetical protein